MLTRRVIPCLDIRDGRVVKGTQFKSIRDAGDPVELARRYARGGADELVFLDITASAERRRAIGGVVRDVARVLDIPFTVGGGVASVDDARRILLNGADKAGVNTAAVQDPSLIVSLMEKFGRQCVVVAVDARRNYSAPPRDSRTFRDDTGEFWYEVYTYGGRRPTGMDAISWCARASTLGAGEILLTSMDADGTKNGYDITLTGVVSDLVPIPVIGSGGCGTPLHMARLFQETSASAALAASIFHYGERAVESVKLYLDGCGVPVRL